MKIPITKTVFDERELEAVQEPLKSGWVVQGPYVQQFEQKFAEYTGAKHAVACSSCTTALQMALASLNIGPGDEIIVPAFTWIATANVVEYMGAKVVFCDIDLDTFNIDVNQITSKITSATKAIIPVHLFGLMADMDAINDVAQKHKLFIIEDAACGFGSYLNGIHAGNFGDFGCFSFHPRKAITTGEGGMITTSESKQANLCRILRDHGAGKSDLARHSNKAAFLLSEFNHLGYNYRMTDIQGALGVVQMEKAAWIQSQRTQRAKRYDDLLSSTEWLVCPKEPANYQHGYQSYVCRFQPETISLDNYKQLNEIRNSLMAKLEDVGISTRQGTHAVSTLGYYQKNYNIHDTDFPNALFADKLSLSLPLYAQMTDDEQEYVVYHLRKSFENLNIKVA